jgi:hypothetical protein
MDKETFDHERFPHQIERGGLTLGVPQPVPDDQRVIVFMTKDERHGANIWVDQDGPVERDLVGGIAIGLPEAIIWRVVGRYWPACDLTVCIVEPVKPAKPIDPVAEPDDG